MSFRHIQLVRTSGAAHAPKRSAVCPSTGRPYTGIVSSDTAVAYDHKRDATMSLRANLHLAAQKVTGQCYRRHPNAAFRKCIGHIRPLRIVRHQIQSVLENHSNYKVRCTSRAIAEG